MEKYLSKCLDSLIIPQLEQIEIVVVNDGSKDSSSSIAHEYAESYPASFKVIDKNNGNYGSCVNRGLAEATGTYVKILDADDCFDNCFFSECIKILGDINCDLVITDYCRVDESDDVLQTIKYDIVPNSILTYDKINPKEYQKVAAAAVIYKTENLKKIGYHQTEGISYTDEEWIFMPMSTIQTVFYINKVLYKYLIGRPGQTVSKDAIIKSIDHAITGVKVMLEDYLQLDNCIDDSNRAYLKSRLISRMVSQYKKALILYWGDIDLQILEQFDLYIQQSNSQIYDEIGDARVNNILPFKYIAFWRKHKQLNGIMACPYIIIGYLYKVANSTCIRNLRLRVSRTN